MNATEAKHSIAATFLTRVDIYARENFLKEIKREGKCWVHPTGWTAAANGIRRSAWVSYAMFVEPFTPTDVQDIGCACGTKNCCYPPHLRMHVSEKRKKTAGK